MAKKSPLLALGKEATREQDEGKKNKGGTLLINS